MKDRKICLLSATPAEPVVEYLNRLFGARWTRISPHNEPPESASYATLPALAPLELTVIEGQLEEWVQANRQALVGWVVQDSLDGALISSSLARVNMAFGVLRSVLAEERMGRITVPSQPRCASRPRPAA